MRKTVTTVCVAAAVLAGLPTVAWGAFISIIDPASSVAVNGSTFTVKVVVTGAWATGSHYVTVTMKGSGGFVVGTPTKSITHLKAGATQTVDFTVRAPAASGSGLLTVVSKWSSNYSGSGTLLMDQRVQPISSNAGWRVSVQLLHPGGLLAGTKPTVWALTNSWRYSAVKDSSSAPYYVTFTVPATAGTYTLGGTWWLLNPINPRSPIPRGSTRTVYISGSGMVVTF